MSSTFYTQDLVVPTNFASASSTLIVRIAPSHYVVQCMVRNLKSLMD